MKRKRTNSSAVLFGSVVLLASFGVGLLPGVLLGSALILGGLTGVFW